MVSSDGSLMSQECEQLRGTHSLEPRRACVRACPRSSGPSRGATRQLPPQDRPVLPLALQTNLSTGQCVFTDAEDTRDERRTETASFSFLIAWSRFFSASCSAFSRCFCSFSSALPSDYQLSIAIPFESVATHPSSSASPPSSGGPKYQRDPL